MTDLDIAPPALPGERQQERKKGFLSRVFGERDAAPKPEFADVDIEEIKRKLGLHEDHETIQSPGPEMFPAPPAKEEAPRPVPEERREEMPRAHVEIGDWTAEVKETVAVKDEAWAATPEAPAPESASPWEAPHEENQVQEAEPYHHALVEQHLSPIDKAHEKIASAAPAAPPDIPEWHLQEKELHPTQYFILRNGQPVKSLRELLDVINYIDDTTFDHHVNEYRNDFAQWIEEAIGDPSLAAQVRSATDRAGVMAALRAHADEKSALATAHARKAETAVRKGAQAVAKLRDTNAEIERLRKEVDGRTQELLGERKRAARLVKGALDKEVERRLGQERERLKAAIAQLEKGKKLYADKVAQFESRAKDLTERERRGVEREERAKGAEARVAEARKLHAAEKAELAQLQKDSSRIRKEYLETKARFDQTEANLKAIGERETELARHEETLRQRETKVSADLTRLHAELDRLREEKAAHAPREAEVKRKEDAARKLATDSGHRAKEALERERASVARIRDETKKLEQVRTRIERALAKILKSKRQVTTAVELRKHLERELLGAKRAIAEEREGLENSGYRALVESTVATTPAGQPASDAGEDIARIREPGFTDRIEQARSALERNDLATARRLYNELRDAYAQVHDNAPERSALYVAIRELYDDINLAMIG